MTTAEYDKERGHVVLRMTPETARNIEMLCRNRLKENEQDIKDYPDLPMQMAASTYEGYESTRSAIRELLS